MTVLVHDQHDRSWDLLTSNTHGDPGRTVVVALSIVLSVDETLNELFDLPLEWVAFWTTSLRIPI
jgi:hypothetical protein